MEKAKSAFSKWGNGNISPLYLASERGQESVDKFIEDANENMVWLEIFETEQEGKEAYQEAQDAIGQIIAERQHP